nr:RNA-directed DNA polymerase, eukaryota [Tanacetum cinerariifolium]
MFTENVGSFAHAIKKGINFHQEEVESKLTLVLDDSFLNKFDMSSTLMGKVKVFCSLSNLKMVLTNEGGWIPDFVVEDENESVYDDVVSEEGTHEENEGPTNFNPLVGDSNVEEVSKTIFKKANFQTPNKDGCNVEHERTQSDDPLSIYDLLKKKKVITESDLNSDNNLKFPPGFTPSFNAEEKSLVSAYHNISTITLDRYLYDHHPILLRKSNFDFGPTPFRFFHYWFDIEGFDEFVKTTWINAQVTHYNAMGMFMKKLKFLKGKIHEWIKVKRINSINYKVELKEQLAMIDKLVDKGE